MRSFFLKHLKSRLSIAIGFDGGFETGNRYEVFIGVEPSLDNVISIYLKTGYGSYFTIANPESQCSIIR